VSPDRRFRRLGLVVHPQRPLDQALATIRAWADIHCDEVVQVRIDGQTREVAPAGDPAACDLIIALGGDGTTLAALHAAAPGGRPVLGVACGSLGALTATSASQLEDALADVAQDRWTGRMLPGLEVTGAGGAVHGAINDLVVLRRGASQVIVGVEVDGEPYVRFAGDGVVVATPLGSSAYTMAAGGPILSPGSRAYVVTPLAPHGGCSPPLVVDAGSRVRLSVEPGWGGARVELDGQVLDLESRELEIGWRPELATLVAFPGGEGPLTGLRRRRILLDSPRVLARDDRAAR